MDLSEDIFDTIDFAITKALKKYKKQDVMTSIKGISSGKFIVEIDGKEYALHNGVGISLKVGDSVWVHLPNGNKQQAYICAKAK